MKSNRNVRAVVVASALLGALFCMVTHANAAPISVLGLNILMKVGPIRTTLEDRGYTCEMDSDNGVLTCEHAGAAGQPTAKVKTTVRKGSVYSMYFGCENFHSCGLSINDTAQELVNAGVVDQMEYQTVRIDGPFLTINGELEMYKDFAGYCARGPSSERLCVIERDTFMPSSGQADVYLRLEGDGQGISFD